MLKYLNRLLTLLKRRSNARRFGVKFPRTSGFKQFNSLKLGSELVELLLPDNYDIWLMELEIFIDDCYMLKELSKNNITKIIDIGANVGLFSIAARSYFTNAIIHAYEPNKELEPYLEHQSRVAKFKYFNEAVGSEEGKCKLIFSDYAGLTQSLLNKADGDLPQTSINKVIKRIGGNADLVKIDIEGSEWELFDDKNTWTLVGNIVMEYHLSDNIPSVGEAVQRVANLGFNNINEYPIYDQSTGIITASRT